MTRSHFSLICPCLPGPLTCAATKITEFEIIKVPPRWVWLRIHTDTELVGLGEPFLENHPDTVIAEVRRLEPLLVGKDPTRVEALWNAMYNSGAGYLGGPVKMSAISGIDMALWDLAGKAAGLPVHKMLGGTVNDRIKVYTAVGGQAPQSIEPGDTMTINRAPGARFATPPEAYRNSASVLVQEWGYRVLKIHFGVGDGLEVTSQVDAVVERFAAVKEGAGPGVDVAIDLHNPNPAIGRQLIEALAPHRPLFVEEPMPIERIDVLTQTATRTSATIAAGERWMGKWAFFDVLTKGVVSVVQPDMCHAGGITECKKIATMAEAAYAKLAIHCPLSSLAFAASVQVDACSPNFLVQEHSGVNDSHVDGKTLIGRGYFKEPFELSEDGCVAVQEGPGLGVEIDDAGLEKIMAKPWSGSVFG